MSVTNFSQLSDENNDTPVVSVIMNCLNCEKYLEEAIDSVYAQTYPKWEIIFWDNASTDLSSEIASKYDQRLHYFCGQKTLPLGAARNLALEKAKGEFIAFLDCDDIWMPNKLELQLPLFSDLDVDLVYSDTIFFDSSGRKTRLYSDNHYYIGSCFRQLLGGYFLSMETVVIRRSALERQPYWFDERFNCIEEADLFRRIGYDRKLAMIDKPLAMWRVHASSWTWKRHELFRQETEQMLTNYEILYQGFCERFKSEIDILRLRLLFNEAKVLWLSGDGKKAREIIKPYFKNSRITLLFLASYFPPSLGKLAIRIVGNSMALPPD